jgi:predicted exporter
VNDWMIIIVFFILGGLTDFIASRKIENSKKRSFVSISIWFVIGIILLIFWVFRQ